ncbi:MAG: MIP family channel protein [Myxococcales bacterium]|nr:MIP family channel protein [Myxococcales bacterium]
MPSATDAGTPAPAPAASEASPTTAPIGLSQKVGAEAVGTFALVFAGCGAIVVQQQTGALGHLGVALCFGMVVAVMIYATGHISGAHFNPAVTLSFAALGRLAPAQIAPYLAGQVGGALAAAALLRLLFEAGGDLGATLPSAGLGQAFVLEVVLTFFLMFVITAVATDARAVGELAGLAIGGTVALCALFGGPITGASMNPARSLAPALVSGQLQHLWLYLTAPVLGALAGAFTYDKIRGNEASADDH